MAENSVLNYIFSLSLDDAEKLSRIVAYVIGGLWVYYNFFKGRTYRSRLEAKVTGELLPKGAPKFIKANIQVKNVGLSKVEIKQKGTAMRLFVYDL